MRPSHAEQCTRPSHAVLCSHLAHQQAAVGIQVLIVAAGNHTHIGEAPLMDACRRYCSRKLAGLTVDNTIHTHLGSAMRAEMGSCDQLLQLRYR